MATQKTIYNPSTGSKCSKITTNEKGQHVCYVENDYYVFAPAAVALGFIVVDVMTSKSNTHSHEEFDLSMYFSTEKFLKTGTFLYLAFDAASNYFYPPEEIVPDLTLAETYTDILSRSQSRKWLPKLPEIRDEFNSFAEKCKAHNFHPTPPPAFHLLEDMNSENSASSPSYAPQISVEAPTVAPQIIGKTTDFHHEL